MHGNVSSFSDLGALWEHQTFTLITLAAESPDFMVAIWYFCPRQKPEGEGGMIENIKIEKKN